MQRIFLLLAACTAALCGAAPKDAALFPLTKDSLGRIQGVLPGETLAFAWNDSKIFPGTTRTIKVYVPRAYDGKTPACVAVFQDSGGFRYETVFDNLIRRNEMPVTIGVVVPPGDVAGVVSPDGARHNRTFEYDTPSDRYARFVLEEILPAVETLSTSDGRKILLSHSGNDRMVAGASSGAAAAFSAAWNRPDAFSRVFSAIGSYTGLRGSYVYPTLVHKTEPRALRLFLQSGKHDMWTPFGDWWMANNAMVRALEYAGYDYRFAFGEGVHSWAHGSALFPEAMRYLWKDWPAGVAPSTLSRNYVLNGAVFQDKRWEPLSGTFEGAGQLVADGAGEVYFSREGNVYARPRAGIAEKKGEGVLWGFAADGKSRIVEFPRGTLTVRGENGAAQALASGVYPSTLVVTSRGDIYAGVADAPDGRAEKILLLRAGAQPVVVAPMPKGVGALCVSADGNWLSAFEADTARGVSFRIEANGLLNYGQRFHVLHARDDADGAGARCAAADASPMGYTYVATDLGVQVLDANGRTGAILPMPENKKAVSLCFGGANFSTLYVLTQDGKWYARPTRAAGATAFAPPTRITQNAG